MINIGPIIRLGLGLGLGLCMGFALGLIMALTLIQSWLINHEMQNNHNTAF